jgi:hypothetical protein
MPPRYGKGSTRTGQSSVFQPLPYSTPPSTVALKRHHLHSTYDHQSLGISQSAQCHQVQDHDHTFVRQKFGRSMMEDRCIHRFRVADWVLARTTGIFPNRPEDMALVELRKLVYCNWNYIDTTTLGATTMSLNSRRRLHTSK